MPDSPGPEALFKPFHMTPDPWQEDLWRSQDRLIALNCCRQAGKTAAVAALAAVVSLKNKHATTVIISHTARQAAETLRRVRQFAEPALKLPMERDSASELGFWTGSRVISLPCTEGSIRGYENVRLLIVDEAARVPDEVFKAARPMLAANPLAQTILLSTPCGAQGVFYRACTGGAPWKVITVPATAISRICPAFLEDEKSLLGDTWFRQEYLCEFTAPAGAVYPGLSSALCHDSEIPTKFRGRYAGIDFGFSAPLAVVDGGLGEDGILYIRRTLYVTRTPIEFIADQLTRGAVHYCDPSAPSEIKRLRYLGIKAVPAVNAVRDGISRCTARLETGRLRIARSAAAPLLAESSSYRYREIAEGIFCDDIEPGPDHALDALRYLVMGVDRAARPSRGTSHLSARAAYLAENGWTTTVLSKLEGAFESPVRQ
jgi:hypothetical protein